MRLCCFNVLTVLYVLFFYSIIGIPQPASSLCCCSLQGWQCQLLGYMEVSVASSLDRASPDWQHLKSDCLQNIYNGRRHPLLSVTNCQSRAGPSVIGSFHTAVPKSPSGTEFANDQLTLHLLPL